jgi:hypothetical protein
MTSDDTTLSRIARFFLAWLASTLLFYALFSLSGCSQGTREGTVNGVVSTYVDPETGVNYMEFMSGYALGVCMRVNADGTPYVSEVGE